MDLCLFLTTFITSGSTRASFWLIPISNKDGVTTSKLCRLVTSSRFNLCCETKTRILCVVRRWLDASEIAQKLMETEDQSYTTSVSPTVAPLAFLHSRHSITVAKQLDTLFHSVFSSYPGSGERQKLCYILLQHCQAHSQLCVHYLHKPIVKAWAGGHRLLPQMGPTQLVSTALGAGAGESQ